METGWSNSQEWTNLAESSKEGYGLKRGSFANDDDEYFRSKIVCRFEFECHYQTKNKLRGLSPQANYTDRATAACRRS
jgi:hypothetical protein